MSKILSTLIASLFAVSAFAADVAPTTATTPAATAPAATAPAKKVHKHHHKLTKAAAATPSATDTKAAPAAGK